MILYGAPVKEEIKKELKRKVKKLKRKPMLVILQVGDREDSNIYIKKKKEFGEEIGVRVILKNLKIERLKDLGKKNLEKEIIKEIGKLNKDKNVDGIIVQLPLPKGLDTEKILNKIGKKKDADGLTSPLTSCSPLLEKERENQEITLITPATAKAVMRLLDFYKIPISDKKVVVIGQSILAGRPIADELEAKEAQVERCDSKTKNIPEIARRADILVSAVGKVGLVTKDFVNKDQVVIDVGINRVDRKLVGDVAFDEVKLLVKAISPVPGGIGPLTVACLFENLLDICYSDRNS